MRETLNERMEREMQEYFEALKNRSHELVSVGPQSMFLGVDAIRLWRMRRRLHRHARRLRKIRK